jgi:hypothetical protein
MGHIKWCLNPRETVKGDIRWCLKPTERERERESKRRLTVVFGSDRKGVTEDYKILHNEQLHDIKYHSRDEIQARIEKKRNANKFGSKE